MFEWWKCAIFLCVYTRTEYSFGKCVLRPSSHRIFSFWRINLPLHWELRRLFVFSLHLPFCLCLPIRINLITIRLYNLISFFNREVNSWSTGNALRCCKWRMTGRKQMTWSELQAQEKKFTSIRDIPAAMNRSLVPLGHSNAKVPLNFEASSEWRGRNFSID